MPTGKSSPVKWNSVSDLLAAGAHPLTDVLAQIRKLILTADSRLVESIKWNAPSYSLNGIDRLTFNLHKGDSIRLIFHCGAKAQKAKARGRLVEDPGKMLTWAADDRGVFQITGTGELAEKANALKELIGAWLAVDVSDNI